MVQSIPESPPSPNNPDPEEDNEEDDIEEEAGEADDSEDSLSESPKPSKGKKRDNASLRKAPQAPKRFKSSYICFFMAKQPEIKEELGDKATVTEISKRSAQMWRNLQTEDRVHWDEEAAKDKERYMVEKASYTGPWQVPWKRAKKDPSAPKRPMSAFLYFSLGKRKQLKDENPTMKNTEVSRLLGEIWRNATEEERRPHVEKEKEEREKYKIAIAQWRKEYEKKKEEQQIQYTGYQEHQAQWTKYQQQHSNGPDSGQAVQPPPYLQPPPSYETSPQATPYGHYPRRPQYFYGPPHPFPPGPYQYPINGKQPVILGPNGMPHFVPPAPSTGAFPYAPPPPPQNDEKGQGHRNSTTHNNERGSDQTTEPQTAE